MHFAGEMRVDALNTREVDVAIGDVSGTEENWACAAEFVVLRSVAIANFQQAIVDELLERRLSHFTRHNPAPSGLR